MSASFTLGPESQFSTRTAGLPLAYRSALTSSFFYHSTLLCWVELYPDSRGNQAPAVVCWCMNPVSGKSGVCVAASNKACRRAPRPALGSARMGFPVHVALVVVVIGLHRPLPARRRAPHALCSAFSKPEFNIEMPSHNSRTELLTFQRLVQVKPYPMECPYDGLELFAAAQPLALQPPPSRAVNAALERFYRQELAGARSNPVLEYVCDGRTRLPRGRRRGGSVQLHASDASLAAATYASSPLEHLALPPLQLGAGGAPDGPSYSLPFVDGHFEAVLTHGCMPYTVAPLPLFEELHRVLRPGGTLAVTFEAPPPVGASSRWAQYASCDPRSASLAWLQAADGADLLYMVGSFFFYSGGWSAIQVRELLPHSPASPPPLYAVTATKLTNKQLFRLKAEREISRAAIARAAPSVPIAAPPPAPAPRAQPPAPRAPAAQPRRRPAQPTAARVSEPRSPPASDRRSGSPQGVPSRAPPADDADGHAVRSTRVRQQILDTIKRGIAENRGRSDLADGERRMLEHMCALARRRTTRARCLASSGE